MAQAIRSPCLIARSRPHPPLVMKLWELTTPSTYVRARRKGIATWLILMTDFRVARRTSASLETCCRLLGGVHHCDRESPKSACKGVREGLEGWYNLVPISLRASSNFTYIDHLKSSQRRRTFRSEPRRDCWTCREYATKHPSKRLGLYPELCVNNS